MGNTSSVHITLAADGGGLQVAGLLYMLISGVIQAVLYADKVTLFIMLVNTESVKFYHPFSCTTQ